MSEVSPTSGPKTWFSGESSPQDKRNLQVGFFVGMLFLGLALPISLLSAFVAFVSFTRFRIKHTVLIQAALVLTVLMFITGALSYSISHYVPMMTDAITSITTEGESFPFAQYILVQFPIASILGAWFGAGYCFLRWIRRSVWEEYNFRLTPLQALRKRRNINNIKTDRATPLDGVTLGVDHDGKRVNQLDTEAAAHTLLIGASGTGKTTTRIVGARDAIKRGSGFLCIDLKADSGLAETLKEYADRYGKQFYHFSFHDPSTTYLGPSDAGPAYYDPLARGDASRRKDMIIGGRVWASDYFKILASSYLQTAFSVMINAERPRGRTDALADLIELMEPSVLADRSRLVPDNENTIDFMRAVHEVTNRKMDNNEKSVLDGMLHELNLLRNSSAGRWLRRPQNGEQEINLVDAAHNGDIVLFSLDSLGYPETSRMIANFIIGDLKTVASELLARPASQQFHVFIDEFAALGSETVTNLINKSRSSGMPTTLATQALGDLKRVDPAFLDQLLGIVNCFIVHRTNTLADAELLAGIGGKAHKWNVSLGVEHTSGFLGMGRGAATGTGRVDRVDDYIVPPKEIQELETGECFYIAKSPKAKMVKVKVIPERDNITTSGLSGSAVVPTPVSDVTTPSRAPVSAPDAPVTHTKEEDDEFLEELLRQRDAKTSAPSAFLSQLESKVSGAPRQSHSRPPSVSPAPPSQSSSPAPVAPSPRPSLPLRPGLPTKPPTLAPRQTAPSPQKDEQAKMVNRDPWR